MRGGPGRSGISDMSRDGGGKLSCKGVVSVLDIVASDCGGGGRSLSRQLPRTLEHTAPKLTLISLFLPSSADFSLHLLRPPMEPSPRWSGRASRCYTVVHPPQSVSLDPQAARADKHRFVHNLWAAQALLRARGGKSSVLVAAEEEKLMEGWGKGRARAFWNVWGRESWESEGGKVSLLLQWSKRGRAKRERTRRETDAFGFPLLFLPGQDRRSGRRVWRSKTFGFRRWMCSACGCSSSTSGWEHVSVSRVVRRACLFLCFADLPSFHPTECLFTLETPMKPRISFTSRRCLRRSCRRVS